MKKILITGATGFLGRELLRRLIDHPDTQIVCMARGEKGLIELKQQYPAIEIFAGDVGDPCACRAALAGVTDCYHLAAQKHIGLAEANPYACVQTNVTGTINLLQAFCGEVFVAVSTDKAAQVNGVYGATKFLMERVIDQYQTINPKTKYRYVRYGNVLYSTGSVLCKWKELIQKGEQVTITDLTATRFFWTVEQAVDHIFAAIARGENGKPYLPEMKACSIHRLLQAMVIKYGQPSGNVMNTIGLQPGENLHETMDGKIFSNEVEQYTVEELMKLI